MKTLYEVILLLFFPRRFNRISVERIIAYEFEHNTQLRSQYTDRHIPANSSLYQDFYRKTEESTAALRNALKSAFQTVLISIGLSWITALILGKQAGKPPEVIITLLQVFSAAILLGATLGLAGWEIQTSCGVTMPEKVNKSIYRILYSIGTYTLLLSLLWK